MIQTQCSIVSTRIDRTGQTFLLSTIFEKIRIATLEYSITRKCTHLRSTHLKSSCEYSLERRDEGHRTPNPGKKNCPGPVRFGVRQIRTFTVEEFKQSIALVLLISSASLSISERRTDICQHLHCWIAAIDPIDDLPEDG